MPIYGNTTAIKLQHLVCSLTCTEGEPGRKCEEHSENKKEKNISYHHSTITQFAEYSKIDIFFQEKIWVCTNIDNALYLTKNKLFNIFKNNMTMQRSNIFLLNKHHLNFFVKIYADKNH